MRDETPSSENCSRSDPSTVSESDVASYLQNVISEARTRQEVRTPALAEPEDTAQGDAPTRRTPMSDQLLDLFRRTEEPMAPAADTTSPDDPAPTPSPFLRRYLHTCADPDDRIATGLPPLDARLGGGMGPGLHVVTGGHHAPLTAFALSLIWESVSSGRPVLFYALHEDGEAVWMRLGATLAPMLGFPRLTLAALRRRRLDVSAKQELAHVDRMIQASILPLVRLIDRLPLRRDPLDAFLEDVSGRARDVREQHGRTPLVVLDGVARLAAMASDDACMAVLERLSHSPVVERTPIIVTAHTVEGSYLVDPPPRARAILDLGSVSAAAAATVEETILAVQVNAYTGWTGELLLLFDTSSGFVAAGDDAPEDNGHE